MDELKHEKESGLDLEYLMDVPQKKDDVGDRYQTPEFGIAAQLFSSVAKCVMEKLGPEQGEELLKEAIEEFGRKRGKMIAGRVEALGKPLTFKNWLIYMDIDPGRNFQPEPSLDNGDLVVKMPSCTFFEGAREWGLGEYAYLYCKYADLAILEGYNPAIKLIPLQRQQTGEDFCLFRYVTKETNK